MNVCDNGASLTILLLIRFCHIVLILPSLLGIIETMVTVQLITTSLNKQMLDEIWNYKDQVGNVYR